MDITRNQFYMTGLVLLFLGIQFRMIESVELKPDVHRFLSERSGHPLAAMGAQSPILSSFDQATGTRIFTPPEWIGWLLVSAGSVLVLHSLAMPKTG